MVGILASMAAGFAAGGAKAYGDVVDDRIKTKLDLAKEAALEARMKNMMELQQKYQTSERLADQEFQTRNEADKKAQDQSLVNYMSGVSEVGGDEYSVPIDKNDFKKGMSADAILAVKSLESAEEEKEYKRGRDIEEDKLKREEIAARKQGTGSNEFKAQEIYNRAYVSKYKALIDSGIDDAEADQKAHEYASKVAPGVVETQPTTPAAPVKKDMSLLDKLLGLSGKSDKPEETGKAEAVKKEPEQPKQEEIKPIGEIKEGVSIGRSAKGYMVNDGEGWRQPTEEEAQEINIKAQKGQLGQTTGWQYENKIPNIMNYSEAMGQGILNKPNMTKSDRMR
jgi:hypothetical protein